MTVQNVTGLIDIIADGIKISFDFEFRVDDSAWANVSYTGNLTGVTLNADQDISPGGSVEYSVAPPNLTFIRIERITPLVQALDYTRYDPFDSESHESALDKLTMAIQDLANSRVEWQFKSFADDYTPILPDASLMLQSTGVTLPQMVTIPPNSIVPFKRGAQLTFERKGTVELDFRAGASVNIDTPSSFRVAGRYGMVTLIQDEIDNWILAGNLKP